MVGGEDGSWFEAGTASCLRDLFLWNAWNCFLQTMAKWTLAFRYPENLLRFPATFLTCVETTHVLIKIIICKIYHILCLFRVSSQPWKAWVMLCGEGSWLCLSLCWSKMRNKGGRDYFKIRGRKWTHTPVAMQDQEISWCALVCLGMKIHLWWIKEHRKRNFLGSVLGWWGREMGERTNGIRGTCLCSSDW